MSKKVKEISTVDQLFKKPIKPKGLNIPHMPQFENNYYNQADLLFLPNDDGYKYALVVVDVGSRLVDARAIKDKNANSIIKAFESIYKGKILKAPSHVIGVDSGSEFKGDVLKYLEDDLGLTVKTAKPGRHKQQSIVEIKNRDIGKLLFKRMTEEELQTNEISKSWVDDLPDVIKHINQTTKKNIPKKNLNPNLKYQCSGNACDVLSQGSKVRVALDEPRDILGHKLHGRFRETDVRWSVQPKEIMKSLVAPGNPPLYLLNDDKGNIDYSTAYNRSELQPVSEKEIKPSEKAIKGIKEKGIKKWYVDEILSKEKINNRIYYKVKYKGFKNPELVKRTDLIKDIPDMIKEFERNT